MGAVVSHTRFISNTDDTSPQKHFARWETIVARIEEVNDVSFPGNVKTATAADIEKFVLDNLHTTVCQESEASFKRCFNDEGEAIECLVSVKRTMAASNVKVGQVFHPIPVAPPIAPPRSASIPAAPPLSIARAPLPQPAAKTQAIPPAPPLLSSSSAAASLIPAAPPLLDTVVLGQIVVDGKVAAVVRPEGMQMVDRPFSPAPGSEVVKGTPQQNASLLEAIRASGGKTVKSSVAKRQVEQSAPLVVDLDLVATTGPGGRPTVVPVAAAGGSSDLLAQIRAGRALKKASGAGRGSGGGGSIASALSARKEDPLLAALAKRRSSVSDDDEDEDGDWD